MVKTRLMSNESDNSAKNGISIISFFCIVKLSAICDRVVYQVFCGVVPLRWLCRLSSATTPTQHWSTETTQVLALANHYFKSCHHLPYLHR